MRFERLTPDSRGAAAWRLGKAPATVERLLIYSSKRFVIDAEWLQMSRRVDRA